MYVYCSGCFYQLKFQLFLGKAEIRWPKLILKMVILGHFENP